MDVKLLEAFRAVVDSRSVTAAAQALGITQPAVSGQIAKLEESVGFPLFERAGGRLRRRTAGCIGAPGVAPFRRGESAPADRRLRSRHRRAAGRRYRRAAG